MKKGLLLSLAFLFISTLQAQIVYTNYGDTWKIPANANEGIDVDGNGSIDFHVNGYTDELGFVPILAIGCFTRSASITNNLGSKDLKIHPEGDFIRIDQSNMIDYIDTGRGSIYSMTDGFADGWTDMEAQYIGFAVFVSNVSTLNVLNGWVKVSVDKSTEMLIIHEIAYEESEGVGTGGINAGETGLSTGIQTIDGLNAIKVMPNPASDFVQLAFDYTGNENLTITIQNSIGQEVYRNRNLASRESTFNIGVADWAPGVYLVRFETLRGIETKKLLVNY